MKLNSLVGSKQLGQGAEVARRAAEYLYRRRRRIVSSTLYLIAWGFTAIFLGLCVGFAVVYLPPTGAVGIVAAVGPVLLWAMPDLAFVPDRTVRWAFYAMVVVVICVPFYYCVQFVGLPWISVRRVATVFLIVPLALAISGSSAVRTHIVDTARAGWPLVACAAGFLLMIFISMPTSISFSSSVSGSVDAIFQLYLPFVAILLVVRTSEQVLTLLRVICICAVLVGILALIEFRLEYKYYFDIFPASMLQALAEQNWAVKNMLKAMSFRQDIYRATSIFAVSLSLGEFGAMMAPVGLYFAIYGGRAWERVLGAAVVVFAILSVFFAGARGGWMALIASMLVYTIISIVRAFKFNKQGLAAPSVAVMAAFAIPLVILSIFFVDRIHNTVLGSGVTANSDQERQLQWAVGIPVILRNPILGYGYGTGGDALFGTGEYSDQSIDSGVLSLLLETGVPGFLFFAGMVFWIVWNRTKIYWTDPSPRGAISGALACSAVAFMVDRTVLSQRENHELFFMFAGITVVLSFLEAAKAQNPVKVGAARPYPMGRPAFDRRPQ